MALDPGSDELELAVEVGLLHPVVAPNVDALCMESHEPEMPHRDEEASRLVLCSLERTDAFVATEEGVPATGHLTLPGPGLTKPQRARPKEYSEVVGPPPIPVAIKVK